MSKKITFLLSISLSISLVVGLSIFFLGQQALGVTFGGAPSMGLNKITSLGTPGVSADASTKGYVDALSGVSGNFSVGGSLTVSGNSIYTGGNMYLRPNSPYGELRIYENTGVNYTTHEVDATYSYWAKNRTNAVSNYYLKGNNAGRVWVRDRLLVQNAPTGSWGDACWYAGFTIAHCSTSLAKDKLNIKDLEVGLDTVMQLTPREFDWTEEMGGKHDLGLIAEEVELVNPLLATYHIDEGELEESLSGVKYKHITALLIKAIQEQQGEIEELRQEIELLKL